MMATVNTLMRRTVLARKRYYRFLHEAGLECSVVLGLENKVNRALDQLSNMGLLALSLPPMRLEAASLRDTIADLRQEKTKRTQRIGRLVGLARSTARNYRFPHGK